ncbi:MAG: hypothetical protein ABGY42_02530 [bacterium]
MHSPEDSMVRSAPEAATGSTGEERKYYFVSGEPVELWENSAVPFGWSEDELARYADTESWESLFNALILAATLEHSTEA